MCILSQVSLVYSLLIQLYSFVSLYTQLLLILFIYWSSPLLFNKLLSNGWNTRAMTVTGHCDRLVTQSFASDWLETSFIEYLYSLYQNAHTLPRHGIRLVTSALVRHASGMHPLELTTSSIGHEPHQSLVCRLNLWQFRARLTRIHRDIPPIPCGWFFISSRQFFVCLRQLIRGAAGVHTQNVVQTTWRRFLLVVLF